MLYNNNKLKINRLEQEYKYLYEYSEHQTEYINTLLQITSDISKRMDKFEGIEPSNTIEEENYDERIISVNENNPTNNDE